jgi:NAD(P)-dependent dehydrogenase (short-subunit alcohol dehydrogenase family)
MKKAIVTGGANGIGRCITKELIREGYDVGVIDTDEEAGQSLIEELPKEQIVFCHGDISEKQELDDFVKKVIHQFEHIDVLINNACYSRGGLDSCGYDEFNEVLRVGVTAPFYLTQQFLPYFSKNASVINISSTRFMMSQADTESYTAAKGAITSLTHGMAVTLRGKVRVNAISPGWIDTQDGNWSDSDRQQHLVQRIGQPIDIANMILYLISDQAGFITGQNFIIDGGMTKQMIYHDEEGWDWHESRK